MKVRSPTSFWGVPKRPMSPISAAIVGLEPGAAAGAPLQAEVAGAAAIVDDVGRWTCRAHLASPASLPALEKAVGLAEPLEGSVERLGRVLDRMPGGRDSRRARKATSEQPVSGGAEAAPGEA